MITSTVALLGTLRELHNVLPGYDLRRLEGLVAQKRPDLLCVEIEREDWESGDLDGAPIEGREVLARLSKSTEMTLIPLGAGGRLWAEDGVAEPCRGAFVSVRRQLFQRLDVTILGLMKLAGGPRAINSALVEHICGGLCHLQVGLADADARGAWTDRNKDLLDHVLWAVRRDPGRRVLVALDCRRKHWLRRQLELAPEVALVDIRRF